MRCPEWNVDHRHQTDHRGCHDEQQVFLVPPGPFVEIRVTDTGRGMPPAMQDRIFEPFFTTKDNGTGLGLSVVYGVVQNHKGFIDLETEEGKGTTFSLFFPTRPAFTQKCANAAPAPHGTEHILVIDDEASVSEIARTC